MNVVGYVRVSTAEQADSGAGLEAQRAAIMAEATRRGWQLLTIYEDAGGILYRSGNSAILVYPSEYAGSNKATAATWGVGDDFDALVAELGEAGPTFEHYDLPDTTREGDIHVMGDMKAVWFKDPDGNILNLVNMQPAIVGAT